MTNKHNKKIKELKDQPFYMDAWTNDNHRAMEQWLRQTLKEVREQTIAEVREGLPSEAIDSPHLENKK